MNKLVASYGIVIAISVGIPFHEILPCGISRKCKSQDNLTFHNNYKMDKPYKSTLPRSVSSSVSILWSLRGVFLFSFFSFLFFSTLLPNLSFSVALSLRILHFLFLKRRTPYWWQAYDVSWSQGSPTTSTTWVNIGRVTAVKPDQRKQRLWWCSSEVDQVLRKVILVS